MIPTQDLLGKLASTSQTTDRITCQVVNAQAFLEQPVYSVATTEDLPDAVLYNGRMVYVVDTNQYYMSVLGKWILDFSSSNSQIISLAFAFGCNPSGQLGDDTVTAVSSPVSVVGGILDWCQISAGADHSTGVSKDGIGWAWGSNGSGRLGDNTTVNKSSPVSVEGITNWALVAAGGSHTLGLGQNSTAWSWGLNTNGPLGDGTTVAKSSPVSVVGGITDWCCLAPGAAHSLGVTASGTAWAWGLNTCGRLGDGTVTQRTSPVSVIGAISTWCQLGAGTLHSIGVTTTGTAWAWGSNLCGRLGDGTVINKSSPVSVVGSITDWCQVSAGDCHSLGVTTTGTAWAWGAGANGRLGDATTANKSSPVSVAGGFTDWCRASAGSLHSLAVRTNGTAWAWGLNTCGRLGDGTVTQRTSPVQVLGENWCGASAGNAHSVVVASCTKGFK
jgi:alpha-tubulin suppressor-like RCC1 family protein